MKWQNVKPVPKVDRPAFAGAIATFGWWLNGQAGWLEDPPAAVVAASVVILMGVIGWLAPRG